MVQCSLSPEVFSSFPLQFFPLTPLFFYSFLRLPRPCFLFFLPVFSGNSFSFYFLLLPPGDLTPVCFSSVQIKASVPPVFFFGPNFLSHFSQSFFNSRFPRGEVEANDFVAFLFHNLFSRAHRVSVLPCSGSGFFRPLSHVTKP